MIVENQIVQPLSNCNIQNVREEGYEPTTRNPRCYNHKRYAFAITRYSLVYMRPQIVVIDHTEDRTKSNKKIILDKKDSFRLFSKGTTGLTHPPTVVITCRAVGVSAKYGVTLGVTSVATILNIIIDILYV